MTAGNWTQLEIKGDRNAKPGRSTCALLRGVRFRSTAGLAWMAGVVEEKDGDLFLQCDQGYRSRLGGETAGSLEFDVPAERLAQQPTGESADGGDRLVRILANSPEWARPSIAKALAPERYAAWQQGQRDARKAQLREIGALASGKPKTAATEKADANAADPRAARRAQLRAIGRAVGT